LPLRSHFWLTVSATICQIFFSPAFQVLKFARARVGGAAQNNTGFVGAVQKRPQGILAQIRLERQSVKTQNVQNSLGVQLARVANVAALGVADGKNARMVLTQIIHRHFKFLPARGTPHFVGGAVWFEGRGKFSRLFNNPFIECKLRILHLFKTFRQFVKVRVQPDAHK